MRKNVIALILLLPLLFVFVVFSSASVASLGVNISANGISILNKDSFDNGTLRIDLADYNAEEHALEVAVSPENATNKGYKFEVAEVEGSDLADVSVDENGVIFARSEGAARVYAVSNDGGYRDSITVLVGSSKAYNFDFALYPANGGDNLLTTDGNGNFTAAISAGWYTYQTTIYPSGFTAAFISAGEDTVAEIEEGTRTVMFPFSGSAELTITVPDGINGDIVKTVLLDVSKPEKSTGVTVNGSDINIITLERGAESASFYVESDVEPQFESEFAKNVLVREVEGKPNCYVVEVTFIESLTEDFTANLRVGETVVELNFSFLEFDFVVNSDRPIQGNNFGDLSTSILCGIPVNFYAVPAVPSANITYEWGVDDVDESIISPSSDGRYCTVNAPDKVEFVLWVEAYRNGIPTGLTKEIRVSVISRVYGVEINNDTSADLAARFAVGGQKYNENGNLVANRYLLDVRVTYSLGNDGSAVKALDDLNYGVSDSTKARLVVENDDIWLVPEGTGEVTVWFEWKGNEAFGMNYRASLTLIVVRNGVEVSTAPQLVKAVGAGMEIVLTADIMLGTDDNGNVLDINTRIGMLGRMKSTYNIEWYKHNNIEEQAYVYYVMEFTDDVYGNGHYINAENFTNARDITGAPLIEKFDGPLYFVSLGQIASVAGQDNIAFLVRNDGVTLYGVNLLSCSDESLLEDGEYDLTKLNTVGTTLEINGDVEIINCRIRNGRNVVRAYGGNRNDNKYFVDSLDLTDNGKLSDSDRIIVRIEGCIISQGREFLLKVGANRALCATSEAEPDLLNENGNKYSTHTNNHLNDTFFYEHYVMTDLTLKDSVLETSGLFAVGVESNFSGPMLFSNADNEDNLDLGGWAGTGGTSFASILRFEGEVRMYDWKDIDLVDSSTLIQTSSQGIGTWLQLNVAEMLKFVCGNQPEQFGSIIKTVGDRQFVHGGIAFYGGGKNYSQLSTEKMSASLSDYNTYAINIRVLEKSEDSTLKRQGEMLPNAAGSQDFRFYMYGNDSVNSYEKQIADSQNGSKYDGVKAIGAF